MTRILLISLNREVAPYPVFPIGVWVLKSWLERHDVQADVADLFLEDEPGALEERYLRNGRYDYVGISIRNIDNLSWPDSVSYLPEIVACVEAVRRHLPADRIFVGGAGYSIFGEKLLRRLELANGIAGEGEGLLLARLGLTAARAEAPDFAFAAHTPPQVLDTYYQRSGMIGIQTRRGCPLDCTYCTYPAIEGRGFRTRPVESVIDELSFLKRRRGIDVFYFVDCLFNRPEEYTLRLLEGMARADLRVRWYAFVNPGGFTAEMAAAMSRAGCAGLELGSEAGDHASLASLRKHYPPEAIRAASESCRGNRIKFCHYLLLGSPAETESTVRNSIDLIRECEPSTAIVSVGIRVYPGTPLEEDLAVRGLLPAGSDLIDPYFYTPEGIDLPGILSLCRTLCPNHWVYPGVSGGTDAARMDALRQRGLRGPLWDYL